MDNKKISNLLRVVADLMDDTIVGTQKEFIKTNEDFLTHSLKLMKKIEENDTVKTYQDKLTKQNKDLANSLKEIQRLREDTIRDMIRDNVYTSPVDFFTKTIANTKKVSEHINEEAKIIKNTMNM